MGLDFAFLLSFLLVSTLPTEEAHHVVPFILIDNMIHFKGSINGLQNLNLIFDTGASVNVIRPGLLKKAGLREGQSSRSIGFGFEKTVGVYEKTTLKVGPVLLQDLRLISFPLYVAGEKEKVRIDGVAGIPLAQGNVVHIDYRDRLLKFMPDGHVPDLTGFTRIPILAYARGVPLVELKLRFRSGQEISGIFLLDTGANLSLLLSPAFDRANRVLDQVGEFYPVPLYGMKSRMSFVEVGRLSEVRLSELAVTNPPIYISRDETGILAEESISGILGNQILKRFNAIFHLQEHAIYLRANEMLSDSFIVDCSGLRLRISKRLIKVVQVMPHSPAYQSKVKVGDTILKVNGKIVGAWDISRVVEILSQPGAQVTLYLRRIKESSTRRVTLHLREE